MNVYEKGHADALEKLGYNPLRSLGRWGSRAARHHGIQHFAVHHGGMPMLGLGHSAPQNQIQYGGFPRNMALMMRPRKMPPLLNLQQGTPVPRQVIDRMQRRSMLA